jgi:hypothetical protein
MTWRAIGASAIGSSHLATMTRCQDACAFRSVAFGDGASAFVAVVADGAGTASSSHHGARTAVDAALARMTETIEAHGVLGLRAMLDAFRVARERVIETARDYGHAPRDYASTLLALAAFDDRTIAAQIGDGAIVVDRDGLRALLWPQNGEYANTTRFLIEDDALANVACIETGPARRAALFSDGLQGLALQFDSRAAYAPFFTPFFDYLETSDADDATIQRQLEAYLESPALASRTDDDKSLVLAVRR